MHDFKPIEIRFLEDHVAGRSYPELTKLFNARFGLQFSREKIRSFLSKKGMSNGIPQGFQKGHISCWKGKKKPYFKYKKAAHNKKPLGAIRVIDGYFQVKISENPTVWKMKHHLIWEAAYGPIPKGHLVMFADGNKSNTNLDNLLLASCAELSIMSRNGLISADRELTKIGKSLAVLKILIRKREKELKHGRKKEK